MPSLIHQWPLRAALLLAIPSFVAPLSTARPRYAGRPTVTVADGTYAGTFNPTYAQDFFLGIPYAQPPLDDLRFRPPQPLNTSFSGTHEATAYSPQCIGYGSDTWVLGNYVSEDCLTINVVRPSGASSDAGLPVAVWIHGGGYTNGGSSDPRYNLSFIVQQSVRMNKPMIAASVNYRLHAWGFMFSTELEAEGSANLGFRDQRLALEWVRENIAAFGGNPDQVTIWGESAGARSVGVQLIAYEGRNDDLFRSAIMESGGPVPGSLTLATAQQWQPWYNAVVNATGCTGSGNTLSCLRSVPSDQLSAAFNSSNLGVANPAWGPVVDGDFMTDNGATLLQLGKFVKVPLLLGTNFDEGSGYAARGINTTDQFLAYVRSQGVSNNETIRTLAALYPDIPAIGLPATLDGRPSGTYASYGAQWKRVVSFMGDLRQHAGRRLTSTAYAANNVSTWTYRFNVLVNGISYLSGATHFQEVAFVFDNVQGLGYETVVAKNPFEGEPKTFEQLASMMSQMWVSFIVDQDPNFHGAHGTRWPKYDLDDPQNIVFDVNATGIAYLEKDYYHAEQIAYINDQLFPPSGHS